jgi:hypothetical protein
MDHISFAKTVRKSENACNKNTLAYSIEKGLSQTFLFIILVPANWLSQAKIVIMA